MGLLLIVGLFPLWAQAGSALRLSNWGPDFAEAKYEETVTDLSVKVLGGYIDHKRHLEDGIDWQFNPAWKSLQFQYALDADPAVDLPIAIKRDTFSYKPVGSQNTPTYVFDERKWITRTDTGWRWQDRLGNWIDYDADGHITAYGDRNNVTVSFTRDTEGRIETVKDHNDSVVLTYAYDATTGKLAGVTDYTGRGISYGYNADDLLETVTDVRGETWRYDYTNFNGIGPLLTGITDPRGNTKIIGYYIQSGVVCVESTGGTWTYLGDEGGWDYRNALCGRWETQPPSALVTSITDGEGSLYQYRFFYTRGASSKLGTYRTARVDGDNGLDEKVYNARGEIVEERRNGRTVSRMEIDGRKRTYTDQNGNVTVIEYDQWRNPIKETYADGSVVSMQYNTQYTKVTQIVDENGIVTEFEYDANGNLTRMIEAVGLSAQRITEYAYDAYGNRTLEKMLADGVTAEASVSMTYDAHGNLSTYRDAEGNVTEFLDYDALGNPRQVRDARGNLWKYAYDAAGNLTREETPLGFVTTYTYDAAGNLETITDPRQKITRLAYDKRNRVVSLTDALNATTRFTHNNNDQITSITDPMGLRVGVRFDQQGRPVALVDPGGHTVALDYGDNSQTGTRGLVNSAMYPTFNQEFGYDSRYRITSVTDSANDAPSRTTRYGYDAGGRLKSVTDPDQGTTAYEYDGLSRVTQVLDAAQGLTQFGYDNRDNLLRVVNPRNVTIRRYQYDRNNNLIAELLPGDASFQRAYDANGNLVRTVDAKGQVATWEYDADNRLTRVRYFADAAQAADPANALKTVAFSYNALGLLVGYDDGVTTGTYTYDDVARLTSSSINYGDFSLAHSYNYYANGLKKSYTGPDGVTYTYSYNSTGLLESVSIPGQGVFTVNRYDWLAPVEATFPGGSKQVNTVDGYQRTTRVLGLDPASNALMDEVYNLDLLGNVLARNTLEAEFSYSYDGLDRLTEVATTTPAGNNTQQYSYDGVGNRQSDSSFADEATGGAHDWVYDERDRLVSRGPISYDYDANGSLVRQTNAAAGQVINYVYNVENRLAEVRDGANNLIARYTYDPFGRRLSKTVGGTTTYFHYSQEGLVAEASTTGAVTTTYGYQPNGLWGTDPLFIKQGAQYGYYLNDHLGTPQRIVASNGAVLWRAKYAAFGEAQVDVSVITNNLRFPGQYFDAETGLHYNYMRYYDPEIGRYITTDPLGLIAGINTYTYAAGNPLAAIDPTGEIIPVVAGWLVKSLFSATVAVVLEIASQYFFNGGHIECIDWADVIMMGVVGAATFGLPGLGKAYKSYKARKELSRQRERATADSRRQKLDRRIKRHGSTVKTIMAIQGAIAAGKFFSKKYINDPDYSETCPNECASK